MAAKETKPIIQTKLTAIQVLDGSFSEVSNVAEYFVPRLWK